MSITSSPADQTPVAAAMTRNVLAVRDDVTAETVGRLMLEQAISGIPVVDSSGHPIGIVSKTDLIRHLHEQGVAVPSGRFEGDVYDGDWGVISAGLGNALVGELMTPMTFKVTAGASLSQAAALMAFEGVHRVVVVAEDGTVAGILSALDVLRWLALHDGYVLQGSNR